MKDFFDYYMVNFAFVWMVMAVSLFVVVFIITYYLHGGFCFSMKDGFHID